MSGENKQVYIIQHDHCYKGLVVCALGVNRTSILPRLVGLGELPRGGTICVEP